MTAVFIDLVDSTVLAEKIDPEPLRQITDRYFAGCSAAVTEHGGVVEKFIGDAVMAVFGAVVSHEDDAIRAVRAAAASLAALNSLAAELTASHGIALAARCGICSGEVMAITTAGGVVRVVGDTVNTASRLQSAAHPGQILVDPRTAALARTQVGLRPVRPLRLKGKADPVPAWEVADRLGVEPFAPVRQAPIVDRTHELGELLHAFGQVSRHGRAGLALVLGQPGIGKSRLAREFLASLAPEQATVLTGRCSAYGRGITYQPLAEMIRGYPGGLAALGHLISSAAAARSLAAIAGESSVATGVEEIAWATRHMIECLGHDRPVILVWEDLHWAEPTLLDLVGSIAAELSGVPVLQVCVARPELVEARPLWRDPSATVLDLPQLTAEQSAELVAGLVLPGEVHGHQQDALCEEVVTRCEGNPLFAELLLDVLTEAAPEAPVPPTIQAVLGARLDQLPPGERLVLDMAAVIGREFGTGQLGAMAEAEGLTAVAAVELAARLAEKRLLQPTSSAGFRFAQSLLRDTTYASTPKARRLGWHMFLAQWFARRQADDIGPREGSGEQERLALACHVEAASQLRRELLSPGPDLDTLAPLAADILIRTGLDALTRKDLPAAIGLLERGCRLLPSGDPRHLSLALRICDAGIGLWDQPRCLAALRSARAALAAEAGARWTCEIQQCIVQLRLERVTPAAIAVRATRIEAELSRHPADDLAWCRYHQLAAYLQLHAERETAAEKSLRLALKRARSMTDRYEEERLLCALCEVTRWTPTPASTGLELCASLAARLAADRALLVPILVTQAYLNALTGNVTDARADLAVAARHADDLRLSLAAAAIMETSGLVESMAGAPAAAERSYRRGAAMLRAAGQVRDAQSLEAAVVRAMLDQHRPAERELAALQAERAPMAPRVRLTVTALRARLASAEGRHDRAARLARRAWPGALDTDDPYLAAEVLLDVSLVLAAAGRPDQAAPAAAQALARLEAKGATLPEARARDALRPLLAGAGSAERT